MRSLILANIVLVLKFPHSSQKNPTQYLSKPASKLSSSIIFTQFFSLLKFTPISYPAPYWLFKEIKPIVLQNALYSSFVRLFPCGGY